MGMLFVLAAVAMIISFVAINVKGYLFGKKWAGRLEMEVAFSEEQAGEGDTIYLYETVVNDKNLILPAVCIKFKTSRYLKFENMSSGSVSDYYYRNDVVSVGAYEKVKRSLKFQCSRRGEYTIDEAQMIGNDLFLRRKFIQDKTLCAYLLVYPSFVGVDKILPLFEHSYGEFSTRIPMFEDPFDYVGVRDYRAGDTMRKINWKLSAKTGRFQVRTSAYTAAEPAVIVLNLESPGIYTNYNAVEECIRIAYSLVFFLEKRGVSSTLVTNAEESFCVSGNGREYMTDVRRKLATISYRKLTKSGLELLARQQDTIQPNDHLFFISASGKKDVQDKLHDLMMKGNCVTWAAPIYDGEDDTVQCLPELKPYVYKWRG